MLAPPRAQPKKFPVATPLYYFSLPKKCLFAPPLSIFSTNNFFMLPPSQHFHNNKQFVRCHPLKHFHNKEICSVLKMLEGGGNRKKYLFVKMLELGGVNRENFLSLLPPRPFSEAKYFFRLTAPSLQRASNTLLQIFSVQLPLGGGTWPSGPPLDPPLVATARRDGHTYFLYRLQVGTGA